MQNRRFSFQRQHLQAWLKFVLYAEETKGQPWDPPFIWKGHKIPQPIIPKEHHSHSETWWWTFMLWGYFSSADFLRWIKQTVPSLTKKLQVFEDKEGFHFSATNWDSSSPRLNQIQRKRCKALWWWDPESKTKSERKSVGFKQG